MPPRHENILDEAAILAFDTSPDAKTDAIMFGRQAAEITLLPDEIQVGSYPPDGVKVTLTRGDRRLLVYFFGDRRFVYGKQLVLAKTRLEQGEMSLGPGSDVERADLFAWLVGRDPS